MRLTAHFLDRGRGAVLRRPRAFWIAVLAAPLVGFPAGSAVALDAGDAATAGYLPVAAGLAAGVLLAMAWTAWRRQGRTIAAPPPPGDDRGDLERRSRLLDTILGTMGEGISVFDHEDRLVAWNDRFIELSGATGVRYGVTLREVLWNQAVRGEFGPCDADAEADRRIRAHWERQQRVLERKRPDGRTIELRRDAIAGGGIVTIYVDITKRKEQERRLAETIEKERELAAQQRRFVTIAAHEFRTPLTIIDGSAQHLMRIGAELSAPTVTTRAHKVRMAVSRMALLIDTMLNSARLDAGSIQPTFGRVDLVALVAGVARRQNGVASEFEIAVSSAVPSLVIEADGALLDQVFTNLVANAIKYSGTSRRIDLDVSEARGMATVRVRDYGIGIPADEIGKLFARFYRASTAKGLPGTGIGLNLVKELVGLHGGRVDVESDLGAGACFSVSLPTSQRRTGAVAAA